MKGGWAELGRRTGESPQALNNWRSRGRIPGPKITKIAEAVGVTTDWLLSGARPRLSAFNRSAVRESFADFLNSFDPEEIAPERQINRFVREYNDGTTDRKGGPPWIDGNDVSEARFGDRFDRACGAVESNLSPAPRASGRVPLISWVQAGSLAEAIDLYAPGEAEAWLPCPQGHGLHTFALRVQGDSMTNPYPGQRSYPEGTLIYVDPDAPADNGRRVVAKLTDTDEVTFKVYVEDAGRKYLKPLNPQYPTIELHNGFEIVGVVIGSYLPE